MVARGAGVVDVADDALMAACACGDAAALGALFERHHRAVHRHLARHLRARGDEADDLVQETFLEVHRSAGGYRGSGAVRGWIIGVAANVARRHIRDRIRHREVTAAMLVRDPDDAMTRSDLRALLTAAIDALSPDLRAAFVLCEIDGVPGVEAARTLGIPAGTLWRRLHDARVALRDALDRA
jgi:RNA polymerase sigma factor (sigma-70 family)